jgi:hypothetical protein
MKDKLARADDRWSLEQAEALRGFRDLLPALCELVAGVGGGNRV